MNIPLPTPTYQSTKILFLLPLAQSPKILVYPQKPAMAMAFVELFRSAKKSGAIAPPVYN
jgi:hypothetical protein